MGMESAPLWKAMLEAQKEIEHVTKDSKNPHLKNTYASLKATIDAVKSVYNKHGLVVTQHVLPGAPGWVTVMTEITHAESGESTRDQLPVPIKHKFKDGADLGPDAQELGSAISYGRRYGLQAMSFMASEDDDGNTAAGVTAVRAEPARSEPVPNVPSKAAPGKEELEARISKALPGFSFTGKKKIED